MNLLSEFRCSIIATKEHVFSLCIKTPVTPYCTLDKSTIKILKCWNVEEKSQSCWGDNSVLQWGRVDNSVHWSNIYHHNFQSCGSGADHLLYCDFSNLCMSAYLCLSAYICVHCILLVSILTEVANRSSAYHTQRRTFSGLSEFIFVQSLLQCHSAQQSAVMHVQTWKHGVSHCPKPFKNTPDVFPCPQ